MTENLNPVKIIIILIIMLVIVAIVGYFYLGITSPQGEQRPLSFVAQIIPISIYLILFASIITIPIYFKWVKKWWFINLIFISFCLAFIIEDNKKSQEMKLFYNEINTTIKVNGTLLNKKTQFYGPGLNNIRSVSFTSFDHKKDSIWTTYARDGSIIEQERFKNDSLIEKIK